MKRFFWSILLVVCCGHLQAAELHVRPGDYSSIQTAINDANHGDMVIVDPCTYYENINFLGRAITLTSLDPNDPCVVAATVINGSAPSDVNKGSVVTFGSGEGNDSVLTGFTITGGTGSWLQIYWEFKGYLWNRCGGGILCYNGSSPTISKNIVTNNIAGQGGGIYFYDHSHPLILENTFTENTALIEHGFEDPNPNDANVYDNGDGGAIVGFQYCDANISANKIENNHAQFYGGGIHIRQWSNGFIKDNLITGNDSALGAGVHVTYTSSPTISDNTISYNQAGGLGGGGIYVYYLSNPVIERNLITQNSSTNGAGIGTYYTSNPTIRNNLIIANKTGAGIRIVGGAWATVCHNTIVGNTASSYSGGGIECVSNAVSTIENNIIAANGQAHGIYVYEGQALPLVRYNNVWANIGGNYNAVIGDQTGLNGNISVNPHFLDPDVNDYSLNYDSPCINAGDPNFSDITVTDYEGQARKMGQYVDMGAFETKPVWNITTGDKAETIQQAIDDANNGQTILLTMGRHTGNGNRDIDFHGKAITLRSIDPNNSNIVAQTIIDCNGSTATPHRGFNFHSGEEPNSVVEGLTITNAGGTLYGAIYCYGSSPTIRKCIITDNHMKDHGGGVYCGYNSNPTIDNCIISNNVFPSVGYGGAIYCYQSSPTVTNCIMINNSAVGHGRHGGGICCWGDQDGSSDPLVVNCIVAGNTAGHRGGGLYSYWSNPAYINCTVIGNRALEGGGIGSFREANPQVINCIVRDNVSPDGNQLALINTIRVWPVSIGTEMTVSYSNIQGGQANATVDSACMLNWGSGNIDVDPNFVDAGYWDTNSTPDVNDDIFTVGNYHLLPGSPCADVGDNNSVPPESTADIDGEQRIFDDVVDMGADELVFNPCDLNTDGLVNLYEMWILSEEWLTAGAELQTDFYDDDYVDFRDFAFWAEHWLWKAGWYE